MKWHRKRCAKINSRKNKAKEKNIKNLAKKVDANSRKEPEKKS